MSDLSTPPNLVATEVARRGALPEAPLPMPEQLLETPRRPWLSLLSGPRRQPGRV